MAQRLGALWLWASCFRRRAPSTLRPARLPFPAACAQDEFNPAPQFNPAPAGDEYASDFEDSAQDGGRALALAFRRQQRASGPRSSTEMQATRCCGEPSLVDDTALSVHTGTDCGPCSSAAESTGTVRSRHAATPLFALRSAVEHLKVVSTCPYGRDGTAIMLRGVWQSAPVAIKLVVQPPHAPQLAEGALCRRLRAPHILETYSTACAQLTAEELHACEATDEEDLLEPPLRSVSNASSSWGGLRDGSFMEHIERKELQASLSSPSAGAAVARLTAAVARADSADSFVASPYAHDARGSGREVAYSEALSACGARPGCTLLQIVTEVADLGSVADMAARGAFAKAPHDRGVMFSYLRTLRDVASALSYLHAVGVVHGALKPSCIMLRSSRADARGYVAKVADFACAVAPGPCAFIEDAAVPYMPPERFAGVAVFASDVWAFAVCALHVWSGAAPGAGSTPPQESDGLVGPRLRPGQPMGMPFPLWSLLQACLAYPWQQRPSSRRIGATLKALETELCGV